jgi:hypothetical protein
MAKKTIEGLVTESPAASEVALNFLRLGMYHRRSFPIPIKLEVVAIK